MCEKLLMVRQLMTKITATKTPMVKH